LGGDGGKYTVRAGQRPKGKQLSTGNELERQPSGRPGILNRLCVDAKDLGVFWWWFFWRGGRGGRRAAKNDREQRSVRGTELPSQPTLREYRAEMWINQSGPLRPLRPPRLRVKKERLILFEAGAGWAPWIPEAFATGAFRSCPFQSVCVRIFPVDACHGV